LLNLYSDKDNIEFEQDLTGSLSLQEAHILITDWSGIGYEFAFALERPVLYVDTPPKCRNEEYTKTQIEPLEFRIRKMVGDVLKPEDIDQAGVYIDRLCEAPEKMAQKIRKVRAQTMFNVGKSAKISADHIINLRSD
jgi:YidC/Oxa1 family membrane protein insertase